MFSSKHKTKYAETLPAEPRTTQAAMPDLRQGSRF